MNATQLDLFGEVLAAEYATEQADTERLTTGLRVLSDEHPRSLELLIGARTPDTGHVKAGKGHRYAYRVKQHAFLFEPIETWGGWDAAPRHQITWDELDELLAGDPRIDELRVWTEMLTAPDAWRDLGRPHELWADPRWHPSYIDNDHARPGWEQRLTAWHTVFSILTDAQQKVPHPRGP